MDDTWFKIILAIISAVSGGGAVGAYVTRRTPDASQQQISQDAFYADVSKREQAAQQRLQAREEYWLNEVQQREAYWRNEVQQRDKVLDECERSHAQAAAELKAAQDRADWLQQRLASSTMWEEHWRKIAQGGK